MAVKMSQLVRWSDDLICTPRQLIDQGLGEVEKCNNFMASSRGKPRKATFVKRIGTHKVVEVSGYVTK